MSSDTPESPTGARFLSTVRHRPRLIAGGLIALAVYLAIGTLGFREATRVLICWNAGAWAYLGLIAHMMIAENGGRRPETLAEDEGQSTLLLLAVVAASAALGAIVLELGPVKSMAGFDKSAHLALVAGTVLSAWAFIHVSFALRYAGSYFRKTETGAVAGGLVFPACDQPGWPEFVYQAFVVGCAFATADVNVTASGMRGIVLVQGVLAFVFNTVILALTINIAAGFF
jgi:uncharacterized membrane protein